MKMLISNIQRFCLNDGPGIRTTVFFMGCPVNCFWCCNPENLYFAQHEYASEGKTQTYGKYYENDELFEELMKDKEFYDTKGGITFSGGECLLYLKDHVKLLRKLKSENISLCIETSLCVPAANLLSIINYIDYFYIDLKIFTENMKRIDYDGNRVKENIQYLKDHNDTTIFRVPLVKGYNTDISNLKIIKEIVDDFNPKRVEIFNIHNLAQKKYETLGKTIYEPDKLTPEELNKICSFLGPKTQVIEI